MFPFHKPPLVMETSHLWDVILFCFSVQGKVFNFMAAEESWAMFY